MKANGQYLIGIDFGAGDRTDMFIVPIAKRGIPNWFKAETISQDEFERVIRKVRDANRPKPPPSKDD